MKATLRKLSYAFIGLLGMFIYSNGFRIVLNWENECLQYKNKEYCDQLSEQWNGFYSFFHAYLADRSIFIVVMRATLKLFTESQDFNHRRMMLLKSDWQRAMAPAVRTGTCIFTKINKWRQFQPSFNQTIVLICPLICEMAYDSSWISWLGKEILKIALIDSCSPAADW